MIRFRLAVDSDCESLTKLINSAYRGESSRQGWTTEEHLLGGQRTDPEVLRRLLAPDSVILMAFDCEALVGCVHLQNKKSYAYLGLLSVSPLQQAGGVGREILTESESWIRKNWQLDTVRMTVITVRKELIAWYLRRGYQDTGEREPFPYHNEKNGTPKVLDLEFLVLEKKI